MSSVSRSEFSPKKMTLSLATTVLSAGAVGAGLFAALQGGAPWHLYAGCGAIGGGVIAGGVSMAWLARHVKLAIAAQKKLSKDLRTANEGKSELSSAVENSERALERLREANVQLASDLASKEEARHELATALDAQSTAHFNELVRTHAEHEAEKTALNGHLREAGVEVARVCAENKNLRASVRTLMAPPAAEPVTASTESAPEEPIGVKLVRSLTAAEVALRGGGGRMVVSSRGIKEYGPRGLPTLQCRVTLSENTILMAAERFERYMRSDVGSLPEFGSLGDKPTERQVQELLSGERRRAQTSTKDRAAAAAGKVANTAGKVRKMLTRKKKAPVTPAAPHCVESVGKTSFEVTFSEHRKLRVSNRKIFYSEGNREITTVLPDETWAGMKRYFQENTTAVCEATLQKLLAEAVGNSIPDADVRALFLLDDDSSEGSIEETRGLKERLKQAAAAAQERLQTRGGTADERASLLGGEATTTYS